MNQRNKKHSAWYSLGLGVLLCIAALVVSTGPTFARYRTERTKDILFAVREPQQIQLGVFHTVTAEEATAELPKDSKVFQSRDTLTWETINGVSQLNLVVANGTSKEDYSERDQRIQLRVPGTLNLWTGEEPMKMYLMVSSAEDPEVTESLQAVPITIEEGTALHYTHGDGWVYTFQGTEGELAWELPGGDFNTIELTLTMEGVLSQDVGLVPQVTAIVTN